MDGSEPREISFSVGGVDFVALEWGQAEGPLALCLHGYPDTAWTWRYLGPTLARQGWHVVAPFMRGYAPTGLAPDRAYGPGALISDAVGMHRLFAGDGPAALIGHDFGAMVGYGVGAHGPELFDRIVTLAVPPCGPMFRSVASPRRWPALLLMVRRTWYASVQLVPGVSETMLDRIVPTLWRSWSPGYDASEDLAHLAATLADRRRRTAILRYYRNTALPWTRSPAYAREQSHWMGVPSVPVLYLHGAEDGCVDPSIIGSTPKALPNGSHHALIPEAGHFLHLEQADTVNRMIAEFLAPLTHK